MENKEPNKLDSEKQTLNNLYEMLHECRNWNKEWDTFCTKKPDSVDEFVKMLSNKYTVTKKA